MARGWGDRPFASTWLIRPIMYTKTGAYLCVHYDAVWPCYIPEVTVICTYRKGNSPKESEEIRMKRTFESKKNEYRYRKETTQENLEMQVTAGDGIVAKYGDHILMADRYWNGGFIAGIYEFVETPEETGLCECECRLNLIETSEGTFPDGGHALEWAISRMK